MIDLDTDKLAKEHRLSRVIESISVGKDGKATVVVTVYCKSSEGEHTVRLEKYWYFKQIQDSSNHLMQLSDRAKSWATLKFLNIDPTKKEEEKKEVEEAKEEEAKEEPKPASKKKKASSKKKAKTVAKVVEEEPPKDSGFTEVGEDEEEPAEGFVAEPEPEQEVPEPIITKKKKKASKKKVAKKSIIYDGRNTKHTAILQGICKDKLGEHYQQFVPQIRIFIRNEAHEKLPVMDADEQVLDSFKEALESRIDSWLK